MLFFFRNQDGSFFKAESSPSLLNHTISWFYGLERQKNNALVLP